MSHVSDVSRVFPEPPFAPEVIADLHAGALDDDVAAHVRSRLPQDPAAQQVLESLQATTAALNGLPAPDVVVPESVRAASEETLGRLEEAGPAPTEETPEEDVSGPSRRFSAIWLVAAAVVGVFLGGVLVAVLMAPGQLTAPRAGQQVATADTAALLAAAHGPQSESLDANRLARCLLANRWGGKAVVGAGYLDYRGVPAQVILTPAGTPGRFDALVTTRDCDAGKPGTLAHAVVGE